MTHSGSLHIREELITSIFSPFSSPAEFCPEDYFFNFGFDRNYKINKILGLNRYRGIIRFFISVHLKTTEHLFM